MAVALGGLLCAALAYSPLGPVDGSQNNFTQLLFSAPSPHSRNVFVRENGQGVRIMKFRDTETALVQSAIKVAPGADGALKVDPDWMEGQDVVQGMLSSLAFLDRPPASVLVIGLGGGAIPNFLSMHYPQTQIDVVEIDPVVVNVARDYMGFKADKAGKLQLYVADARDFVEIDVEQKKYDVVMLDAFSIAGQIPFQLTTQEFFRSVSKTLIAEGLMVMHMRVRGKGAEEKRKQIIKTLQESTLTADSPKKVFPNIYRVNVPSDSNPHVYSDSEYILVADPVASATRKDILIKRAEQITVHRNLPFEMASMFTRPAVGDKEPIEQLLPVNDASIMIRQDKDTPEQAEPTFNSI